MAITDSDLDLAQYIDHSLLIPTATSEQWEGVTRSFAVSCTYTTMNKEAVSRDLILYTTMNHMRSFTVYNHEKEAVSRDLLLYTTMIKEAVSGDILLYTTINKEAVSRDLLLYTTMKKSLYHEIYYCIQP